MPRQQLRDHLDELCEELESTKDLDEGSRDTLRGLVDDIRSVLELPEGQQPEEPSVPERVKDSVQEFEASHPRLAARLGRVVDLLNAIGI